MKAIDQLLKRHSSVLSIKQIVEKRGESDGLCPSLCLRAPSGARFLRVKVPNPPGSGKDIAEGKGVHREVESEGSWM